MQVAVRVRRDPAGPPGAAGQPRRRRGDRERRRVEALDPALDRRRLRPAQRDVVAQRVELARLAPDEQVGGEGVVDGGDLEPLAGPDAEPRLSRRRTPSAAARRPRRSTAAASRRRLTGSGVRRAPGSGPASQQISAARSRPAARSARAARTSGSVASSMKAARLGYQTAMTSSYASLSSPITVCCGLRRARRPCRRRRSEHRAHARRLAVARRTRVARRDSG